MKGNYTIMRTIACDAQSIIVHLSFFLREVLSNLVYDNNPFSLCWVSDQICSQHCCLPWEVRYNQPLLHNLRTTYSMNLPKHWGQIWRSSFLCVGLLSEVWRVVIRNRAFFVAPWLWNAFPREVCLAHPCMPSGSQLQQISFSRLFGQTAVCWGGCLFYTLIDCCWFALLLLLA